MRKNYRYSKEYKIIDFSGFIFEKGRKRYRRQKEKLLFSIILDLANCSVKPKRLSETKIKHVESLEVYLREVRGNAESTINNKIYLFVKALNKIGVNLTYKMKSIETKKLQSSKFYRTAKKIIAIKDETYRKIALIQSKTGLSYSDMNGLSSWFLNSSAEGVSGYTKPDRIVSLKFDSETQKALESCVNFLTATVQEDYGLRIGTKLFPVKKSDYIAFRTLYLCELNKIGLDENDIRSVGYISQWKAYIGESIFKSIEEEDSLLSKLRLFRNNMGIKDNRTAKKFLGIGS
jgi:hypothetical protein